MSALSIWIRTTLLGVAALLAISPPVAAADYPSRPVTLVVAFTPGGPSDVLARIVGKKMEQLQCAVRDREPSGCRRQSRGRNRRACGA
jgi:hypothetical protein